MQKIELVDYLRAGFPVFLLKTSEPDRVKKEILPLIANTQRKNGEGFIASEWDIISAKPDPMSPLLYMDQAQPNEVIFLFNYHWFIDRQPVIQKIQNSIPVWASKGQAIVIVSPIEKIPVELKKIVTLIEMPLPDEEEIVKAMDHVRPDKISAPEGEELSGIIRVSKGLTRLELENIYALCITKHSRFDISTINDFRALTIKKSGLADILPPTKTFADVIGYQIVKDQVMETIFKDYAKGIIAIGPTGTGKTSLMQAIATEAGKLAIKVRTGKLFSKYQGETDQKTDALIDMIESIGDCYVLFDEFEKQFSGVGGHGELDSGTTTRMGGRFLEFFQDTPKNVYKTATCNTFRGIPPEYFRPGRWDSAPWYVGLPTEEVKSKILEHYVKKYDLSKNQVKTVPRMPGWTGAEIEALCHNAHMRNLNLSNASKFIIPMSLTAKEDNDALENWAKDRCINAEDLPKISTTVPGKRRVDI